MGNFWLKIKIWSKITFFSLLVIYALCFVANNSGQNVHLWIFLGHEYETSILYFTIAVFFTGVIGTLLVRTTFKTIRQIRELQQRGRTQKLQRDVADMQAKAALLQTRPDPQAADITSSAADRPTTL